MSAKRDHRSFIPAHSGLPTIRELSLFADTKVFTCTDPVRVAELGFLGLNHLFQLRGFCFSFFQDWDVGVRILPEREEVLICSSRLQRVASQDVRSRKLETRKGTGWKVQHDSGVTKDYLEV